MRNIFKTQRKNTLQRIKVAKDPSVIVTMFYKKKIRKKNKIIIIIIKNNTIKKQKVDLD